MNRPGKYLAVLARVLFASIALGVACSLLFKATSHPATTQAPEKTPKPATVRLLENRVPEHLPIRVKIRREKEKTFRDLNNENWARDLELEVKNIGDKPIYFLDFALHV